MACLLSSSNQEKKHFTDSQETNFPNFEIANSSEKLNLTVKTLKVGTRGFADPIFIDQKKIHQPSIPGTAGEKAFSTLEKALKAV